MSLELRPGTLKFFHMLHQYLRCRELMDAKYEEIDPLHTLSNLEIPIDSGGIQHTDGSDPWQYKAIYRQQAVTGSPVTTSDELYEAALRVQPVYQAKVQNLRARVCGGLEEGVVVIFPPLKGRKRALEKANDDYIRRKPATAISWLYDVVRGSVHFATIEQIKNCIEQIKQCPDTTIVKAKNRFQHPGLTGYRDINLHICIEAEGLDFQHICELQIHLLEMKELEKELNSHKYYEYFRSYFSGAIDSLKDRMDDLKAISDGSNVDEEFLTRFLEKTTDVARLQRLAQMFYNTLCEYGWAYRVYDQVLEIQRSSLGDCHVDVAKTLDCMGEILRTEGKSERAAELHHQALSICEQLDLDQGSEVLADIYNNLANALYYQDKLDEALELYDKALKVLAVDGAGSHQIAMSVTTNNMANIVYEQGDREKALELYESALQIQEKALGLEHPSVAETYANVATVLIYRNKFEEALELQKKVVDIRRKLLGEKHYKVFDAYKKLADTHSRLSVRLETKSKYDEALIVLREELAIRQQMASGNERKELDQQFALKIADVHHNISIVMVKQGKLTEALENLEKSLGIRQNSLSEQHYTVVNTIKQKEKLLQKIEKQL